MYIYKELSQEMDENIFLIFLSTADFIVNPFANFIDVKNDLPVFILITFMIWKHVFSSEITTEAVHIFRDIGLLPVSMHNNDCGLHNLKVDLEKLGDLDHLELLHHLSVENAFQEDYVVIPGSKHVSEEHMHCTGRIEFI